MVKIGTPAHDLVPANEVTLPEMAIEYEFGWTGIVCDVAKTIGNHLHVVETQTQVRPLTLKVCESSALITRATLAALLVLAKVPNATYTLTMDSVTFTVRFRNEEQPVIVATPLTSKVTYAADDKYVNLVIKLSVV